MGKLTADQYAAIADSLTNLAAAINTFLNNHPGDPSFDELDAAQQVINAVAAELEQRAALADYQNSTAAFAKLTAATTQINATTARLQQQVVAIGRIVGTVAKAAALASALSGGLAGPILASADQLLEAARG